jgi:50S ribosomal subunit-associated GTPase HflX
MDKMLVFVLNKYDLINDEEIAAMYQEELNKHVVAYFKKTFDYGLTNETINHNTFIVSGATRHGLDHFLTVISQKMKDYNFTNKTTLELVEKHHHEVASIVALGDESIAFLVENNFVEEENSKFLQTRQINEPAIIKAAFQTMRGNDE